MSAARLTPRQIEVIRLLAETGGTDKAIANRLGISHRTVEAHIERARLKIGPLTRAQLVGWAFRNGIAEVRAA